MNEENGSFYIRRSQATFFMQFTTKRIFRFCWLITINAVRRGKSDQPRFQGLSPSFSRSKEREEERHWKEVEVWHPDKLEKSARACKNKGRKRNLEQPEVF